MDIESLREYCLSLPLVTEDFPFEPSGLAFRVMDKIFAYVDLDNPGYFVMKCNPEYAIELRERHECVSGAFHWNKKYWNQVDLSCGRLRDEFIMGLIRHSYSEVVRKLPLKVRMSKPELAQVAQ